MNLAVEFHDSDLAKLEVMPESIRLTLRPAMLHSSEGVPGRDSGTVASGSAELTFFDAALAGGSVEASGTISDAELVLEEIGEDHFDFIPTSRGEPGDLVEVPAPAFAIAGSLFPAWRQLVVDRVAVFVDGCASILAAAVVIIALFVIG